MEEDLSRIKMEYDQCLNILINLIKSLKIFLNKFSIFLKIWNQFPDYFNRLESVTTLNDLHAQSVLLFQHP